MSITTAQTLQSRRPNSTHLESLLVTDFYGINAENGEFVTTTNSSPSPPSSQKDYYIADESSINHKRERSLPISNYSTSFSTSETSQQTSSNYDDALIYANLDEIKRKKEADLIDKAPRPPIPNEDDQPIRILRNSGWQEFKTIGGRSYFFNSDIGVSQWMPPRSAKRISVNKVPPMIEPTRKQSFCDALSNSYTSSCRLEKQNSKCSDQASSLSTDSTSTESLKYAEPPLVISTHVTNPLIDRELSLSKAPPRLDEKSTSFRGPALNGNQMAYRKFAADDTKVLSKFPGPSNSNSSTITTFPVSTIDMSSSMSSATSSMRSRNFFAPSSAIHQGTLDKCRLMDGWQKVKKNQWGLAYAILYSGHLLFYRDQKSAEKNGKHYPAPLDVCDLRGAKLCHVDSEKFKDKRHKAIISLQLPNNNIYLFSTIDNEANIQDWFHALKDAILSLPQCPEFLPPLEHGSLGRPTNKIVTFNSKQSLRHSIKNGSKTANNSKNKVDAEIPNKDSIIDRLLRFLRSRPTMEHLSERGIYKLEPVFGSNLTAICEHDRLPVPRFVTEATAIIEKRGLKVDGLYRVSGNLSSIQKLRCLIDQDKYDALNKEDDVHVLTGLFKLFFRELSDPIIPYELNKEFLAGINESPRNRFKVYDELLKRLPEVNRRTLALLIGHLRRVAQHSSENRMQIHNLAIVFGPALFHTEGRPAAKTHQRRNSGFLSKKQPPTTEQKTMPSQNLAYKMVVFGQITESILNDAEKFQIFAGMPV